LLNLRFINKHDKKRTKDRLVNSEKSISKCIEGFKVLTIFSVIEKIKQIIKDTPVEGNF
tara:strand:+ start:200 stop:376 length:177 start_codon:yes stop_codon:yes gene_type:complete